MLSSKQQKKLSKTSWVQLGEGQWKVMGMDMIKIYTCMKFLETYIRARNGSVANVFVT